MKRVLYKVIDPLFHLITEAASSKLFFMGIVAITSWGIIVQHFIHNKSFDASWAGDMVFWYTIWFAWVEGVMKIVQNELRNMEEKRQELLQQLVEETNKQTKVIHNLVQIQLALGKKTLRLLEKVERQQDTHEEKEKQ